MTTATEPTTEEAALWASIGEMPECQLRRGVAADWFEERSGKVECPKCNGTGKVPLGYCDAFMYSCDELGDSNCGHKRRPVYCPACREGRGYTPDRNGRLAAALRATADRVPRRTSVNFASKFWWNCLDGPLNYNVDSHLSETVFMALKYGKPKSASLNWWEDYPTAADAIRDLCEAYIKVTYGEVGE